MTNEIRVLLILIVGVILVCGATADAADFSTESCLAQKRKAQGKFQKCRAGEAAKLLQGKPADLATCTTIFQEKLAKLSAKATAAGIACRYRDNGDGTVSDYDTGLQWEKKDGADGTADLTNPHDVDNTYAWIDNCGGATGSLHVDHLERLACTSSDGSTVTGGLAGQCDWRLPTLAELSTILLEPYPCATSPCIDAIFGPTKATNAYWSSIRAHGFYDWAWAVVFGTGGVGDAPKDVCLHVRAVRGGL